MEEEYTLSIIVPVYNEVNYIERVINDIYGKIINNFDGKVELVVAEDGSTDGTKELLARLQNERGFRLVSGIKRKGYNSAVKNALSLARGTYVFMCDSGGAHEVNDFFKLYQHIGTSDVVSGHKKKRGDPPHRIFLSRVFNLYVSLLFSKRFYDIDCGFKLYRKKALDEILPSVTTLKECVSTEIMLRLFKKGYRTKEVPVIHYKRNFDGPAKTFSLTKLPKLAAGLSVDLVKLYREI